MKNFIKGCSRAVGIVAGFLPIAMSFGAVAIQSGLSQAQTAVMSMWVFAGASQFIVVEGIEQNLDALSLILTIWLINLRHIPMSLAAQKRYGRFGKIKHLLLCYGLVDETFVLESSEKPQSFAYYLGLHLCCWTAWVIGTIIGASFGELLPENWLKFALPGLFLCLLVDLVRQRWCREMALLLGIGTLLILTTQSFGSTGILLSIIAIAIAASQLLPQEDLL
jgi:4-azaleucine resistance transporter AzlC